MNYFKTLLLFLSLNLFAQEAPPQGINYQAIAFDFEKSEIPGINLESKPLANKTINLRFSIIRDSETGIIKYIETHEITTDENGLFNTVIGQGIISNESPLNFNEINWGDGYYFLKVEISKNQDDNYKDMGTNQLWSVPYSLYSKKAANGIESITDNGDGTLTFTYLDGSQYITPVLTGLTGPQGSQGDQGPEGRNAYQIWLDQGNTGDTLVFLSDLKGDRGNGIISTLDNGDGTFTITYDDGTTFTTSDLRGANGNDGNGIASTTDNGDGTFTLTYDDGSTFTTSDLTGPQGVQGIQGLTGATGPAGTNGINGTNGADGNGIASTTDNGDGTFTFTYDDGTTFTTSDLTGPQGVQGVQGLTGATGPAGTNGTNGTNGADGNGIASTTDNGDGTFTFTYDDATSQLINLQDNDRDSTNELQVLSLSNDTLSISNGNQVYIGLSSLVSQNIVAISSTNRDTLSCVNLGTVIYNSTTNKYEGSILSGLTSEAICPNLGGGGPYNNYFSSGQTFTTGTNCGYFKEIKMYVEANSFGGTPKCRVSLYKGLGNTGALIYQYDHNSGISHNSWLTTTIPDIFFGPNEVYSIVFENTNGYRVGWYPSSCGYSDGTWIDVDGTSYPSHDHAFEVVVQKTIWDPLN